MPLYPSSDAEDDENPLLALLDEGDDTEIVSFIPSTEEGEAPAPKSSNNDDISERLARLELENERLRSQATVAPVYHQAPQPIPQVPIVSGNADQDQINKLNEVFARNPGAALHEVYMSGIRAAEEAQKRNLYPVAVQNAKFAINQFASTSKMDAETREEFNKLVSTFTPEQLAQADPSKIEGQLEYVRKIAKANVVEAREKANTRAQNPPPFGSTGGSVGKAPVTVKLNKSQKAAWDLGKSQGISEKELYKMYKDGELD